MKLLTLFVLLIFSATLLHATEISDVEQAVIDARQDVGQNMSSPAWFIAGCLCGIFGVGFAFLYEPQVPVSRLMGKSPKYVMIYTSEHKYASRRKQFSAAGAGCLIGAFVSVMIYVSGMQN